MPTKVSHKRTRRQKRHISGGCLFWDLIYFCERATQQWCLQVTHPAWAPTHQCRNEKKNQKKNKTTCIFADASVTLLWAGRSSISFLWHKEMTINWILNFESRENPQWKPFFKMNFSHNASNLVAEGIEALMLSWVTRPAISVGCSSTVPQT